MRLTMSGSPLRFLLILLLLSLPTFGMTQQVSIQGKVVDEQGLPLPGAHVVALNQQTQIEQATDAVGEGDFNLTNLTSGSYQLTVSLDGFQTVTLTPSDLSRKLEIV